MLKLVVVFLKVLLLEQYLWYTSLSAASSENAIFFWHHAHFISYIFHSMKPFRKDLHGTRGLTTCQKQNVRNLQLPDVKSRENWNQCAGLQIPLKNSDTASVDGISLSFRTTVRNWSLFLICACHSASTYKNIDWTVIFLCIYLCKIKHIMSLEDLIIKKKTNSKECG